MLALKITKLKLFTKQLFLQDLFDGFQFMEGRFVTFGTFTMDGRLNSDYYGEEEWEEIGSRPYSMWRQMRPFCFQIIKGNKLPLSFQLVLRKDKAELEKQLSPADWNFSEVESFLLNIRYKNGAITCTTGVSLRQFTMDRTPEQEWDRYVREFLHKNAIDYTE